MERNRSDVCGAREGSERFCITEMKRDVAVLTCCVYRSTSDLLFPAEVTLPVEREHG